MSKTVVLKSIIYQKWVSRTKHSLQLQVRLDVSEWCVCVSDTNKHVWCCVCMCGDVMDGCDYLRSMFNNTMSRVCKFYVSQSLTHSLTLSFIRLTYNKWKDVHKRFNFKLWIICKICKFCLVCVTKRNAIHNHNKQILKISQQTDVRRTDGKIRCWDFFPRLYNTITIAGMNGEKTYALHGEKKARSFNFVSVK